MKDTLRQYENAVKACRDIFLKKTADYGTSWRVLRMISILDQIIYQSQTHPNHSGKRFSAGRRGYSRGISGHRELWSHWIDPAGFESGRYRRTCHR